MKNKRFINCKPPVIEEGVLNDYNWLVQNVRNLKLGNFTDIGAFTYMDAKYGINIDDYVQTGSHSTIMPNVSIGANYLIGANSSVLESLPSNIVAFGVPAKIIRSI